MIANYYETIIIINYLKYKKIDNKYKLFCTFIFEKANNIDKGTEYEMSAITPFSYYTEENINEAINKLNEYENTLIKIIDDILTFLNILKDNGIQQIPLDYSNLSNLY